MEFYVDDRRVIMEAGECWYLDLSRPHRVHNRGTTDRIHLVDVDDYQAMRDALRDHPANVAWQAVMVPLQAVPDDYSGTDTGLALVWSFADQGRG